MRIIIRILRDAYKFFDRHWIMIIGAAILSVGLIDILSVVIRFQVPMPPMRLASPDGYKVAFSYHDLVEAVLFFFASIWFGAFIGILGQFELKGSTIKFRTVLSRATALYPRVMAVNIAAQMLIYLGLLAGLPGLMLGPLGIIFLVPALLLAVWLSLVTPVVAIEDIVRVKKVLARSRILVTRYFWTVLFVIMIGFIPPLAVAGIKTTTIYYWPVTIFVNVASIIMTSVILVSTYLNLRLARGEALFTIPEEELEDNSTSI